MAERATRVLLIDDNPIAIEIARARLKLAGFEVFATNALDDFIEALQSWKPNLILADVDMPNTSGDEICRIAKSHYETAHIPVVLYSGLEVDRLREIATDCEADGYLSKSGDFGQLCEELHGLCQAMDW